MCLEIERTLKNLQRNQIWSCFVKTKGELMSALKRELREGMLVASGSSATLEELRIRQWLQEGPFRYLDCSPEAATREANIRESFHADVYLSSVAALTQDGELFLVDGTGNRTAAFSYGPKRIIVIASTKKITANMDEAMQRLKHTAAPGCAVRRNKRDLPCYQQKACHDCKSKERMCCYYLKVGFSRDPERIRVYLIGEDVGI